MKTLKVLLMKEFTGGHDSLNHGINMIPHHDSVWVAQCIDHDVVAQADSITDVIVRFYHVFMAGMLLAKTSWQDIEPAPKSYAVLYDLGFSLFTNETHYDLLASDIAGMVMSKGKELPSFSFRVV